MLLSFTQSPDVSACFQNVLCLRKKKFNERTCNCWWERLASLSPFSPTWLNSPEETNCEENLATDSTRKRNKLQYVWNTFDAEAFITSQDKYYFFFFFYLSILSLFSSHPPRTTVMVQNVDCWRTWKKKKKARHRRKKGLHTKKDIYIYI